MRSGAQNDASSPECDGRWRRAALTASGQGRQAAYAVTPDVRRAPDALRRNYIHEVIDNPQGLREVPFVKRKLGLLIWRAEADFVLPRARLGPPDG